MAKRTEGRIRAVAFKEGDLWIVHGVEYDLVAQTKELLDVPVAFLQTVTNTILINRRMGRKGLEAIKAAPAKYLEMFESAEMELTPRGPLPVRDEVQRPDISLRAYREQEAA
jgi:hypothetical protein